MRTAMIFAAGRGTRLYPLTADLPKSLLTINQVPLIDLVIKQALEAGISRIVVNTHYQAEKLISHLKQKKNIELLISEEKQLLETAGGLLKALPLIEDAEFLTLNCDILWENKDLLKNFIEFWYQKRKEANLCMLFKLATATKEGMFSIKNDEVFMGENMPHAYCGIQIMKKEVIESIQNEFPPAFPLIEVYKSKKLASGKLVNTVGMLYNNNLFNINHIEELEEVRLTYGKSY